MSQEEVSLPFGIELTKEERDLVRAKLGREPSAVEWAMIDAEWSEHCSYKSSKPILKMLPTEGERVVLGPGYDSGVLDVGDGYVVSVHIESHNHPSAVDPYGGAATGVGGILRDILCVGTKPIALVNCLRFGRIDQSAHSRWLFSNVVRGIGDYGNCTGVPTVAGEVEFDECYERNCLVDVACIGLGRKEDLVLARATNPGDLVVLVGGSTGRDGIHGVTFASRALDTKLDEDRSAVQVPDPFMKKLIIDATMEALASGGIAAMKDLGGGGLTCALSEITDKGGTGAIVELSKINLREGDLLPEEIMVSESQERMLLIVKKGRLDQVAAVYSKYGVWISVIGSVTGGGRLEVYMHGNVVASLPRELVANAPVIERPSRPSYLDGITPYRLGEGDDMGEHLLRLLESPNVASKAWVYSQYDHEVGASTVVKPGMADAAVLRLPNARFLAVKADGNSKHCYLDPYHGAAGCLAEACRNIMSVGAEPVAMLDHMQFGDPRNPEVFWSFREAVRGMADYCKAVGMPCVGGKVSFYNEDRLTAKAIKPTPIAMVVGLVEREDMILASGLRHEGSRLLLVGTTKKELGGSEYLYWIRGCLGSNPPKVDMEFEGRLRKGMLRLIRGGMIQSIHDCSSGGMLLAMAEMCISGVKGLVADCSPLVGSLAMDELLFSESHGRFLVEVPEHRVANAVSLLDNYGIPCTPIGVVGGDRLDVRLSGDTVASVGLKDMRERWYSALSRYMGEG